MHPHALIHATGWLMQSGEHLTLYGLRVSPSPKLAPLIGQRVTAKLNITGVDDQGRVTRMAAQQVRGAGCECNAATFTAYGWLHRADQSTLTVTLRFTTLPSGQSGQHVRFRCTPRVFSHVGASRGFVSARGGLIDGLLVADWVKPRPARLRV